MQIIQNLSMAVHWLVVFKFDKKTCVLNLPFKIDVAKAGINNCK